VILSPQSIFHGVAMSYIASGGTPEGIGRSGGFRPTTRNFCTIWQTCAGNSMRQQRASEPISVRQFPVAGRDLCGVSHKLRPDVQEAFGASLYRVKFLRKEQASKDINAWIFEKTHGKISRA